MTAVASAAIGEHARGLIRTSHGELRALLAALDDAARRVAASEPGAMSELRARLRALDVAFGAHLASEESLLLPAMPAQAAAQLHAEHGEQRSVLRALASDVEIGANDPARLADDARWLVEGLLRDMLAEDRALDGAEGD